MMKTDIHKIKTEQAWNRLYDRLDKDHLLVEDHRMPKIPMWVRYGTVAMVVGLVFSTLYWGFGQKEEVPDFITWRIRMFLHWSRLWKMVLSCSWQRRLLSDIRNILFLINGKSVCREMPF